MAVTTETRPGKSRAPAQTRSLKNNLHPKQFGKHASGETSETSYRGKHSSGYQGSHRTTGKHGKPYDARADISSKPSDYSGSHRQGAPRAEGKHGKPYNPESEINDKITAPSGKHRAGTPRPEGKHGKAYNAEADIKKSMSGKTYIPKHTAAGMKARKKQERKPVDVEHAVNKIHRALHNLHRFEGKNKEFLREYAERKR